MSVHWLARYPVLTAALVALCGVTLIALGSLWPTHPSTPPELQREVREEDRQRREDALLQLQEAGLEGAVEVADFGDALGLGVSRHFEEGEVVLKIPRALALDVRQSSCSVDDAHEDEVPVDCRVERFLEHAVTRGDATRWTGLMTLLIMEHRRGLVPELEETAASAVLQALSKVPWRSDGTIFSIDAEEFRVLGTGTSMEVWRDEALNVTGEAQAFIQGSSLASMLEPHVSMEELRWAYLVLQSHGQWSGEGQLEAGPALPSQVLFLWPLFLARPTPEWQHGARLRYDATRGIYEVLAPRNMQPGDELLFVDRRLTDASALCYRGIWLAGRHRASLVLDVASAPRDPLAEATLKRYGCGGQPLRLFVKADPSIDQQFLGCMRLLALAGNASRLQRVEQTGWTRHWPETTAINRRAELAAADLAIAALQQVLQRLSSSTAEIRQRYGSDTVAARPMVRVREAETTIVVGLLQSMKELQLLASNEYLFEALQESTRKSPQKKAEK